jgi:PPOX class probable F420-dependent enzyme
MIPNTHLDLLIRPVVVSLATAMSNGSMQVQPVWCSYDGEHVLVNTLVGRQKFLNLSRRSVATLLVVDPNDANRWLEIRGRVDGWSTQGAGRHVDELAWAYMGVEHYEEAPGDLEADRVVVRIAPERVVTMGTARSSASVPPRASN